MSYLLKISSKIECTYHSKSDQKLKSPDFYHHSIKVHTQEAQNLHQLKAPLSDPNLQSKSIYKCEHCETRFTS